MNTIEEIKRHRKILLIEADDLRNRISWLEDRLAKNQCALDDVLAGIRNLNERLTARGHVRVIEAREQ